MTTENREVKVCNQCPNQCPITDLKCPKGRRTLEGESFEGGEESHGEHGERKGNGKHGRGRHGRGRHREFEEHGSFGGHGRRRECGHGMEEAYRGGERGNRGGRGMRGKKFDEDSLSGLMHGCGHFLHHRSSGGGGQEGILSILAEKESMSQKELQEILKIQPGSLSEILAKLEHKGLIERERDESDKRKSVIRLTGAGKDATGKADKSASRMDEKELFSVLTEEEQSELKRLLKKLLDYWRM